MNDDHGRQDRPFAATFERYLQDKGKGRGGEGGNYRRNAARELDRFAAWARGERGRAASRRRRAQTGRPAGLDP